MRRRRVAWVLTSLVSVMVAVVSLSASVAAPAGASTDSDEAGFLALVNQERASRGLGRLAPASDLVTVARRHSARMASQGHVFHNSSLSSEVEGWDLLGENVGVGPSVQEIHDALMASKVHRDVIVGPRFTQIGVGVVVEGGEIWLTQVFRLPEAKPQNSREPTGGAEAPGEAAPPATPAPAATPAVPRAGAGAGRGGPAATAARAPAPPKVSVASAPVRRPATPFGRPHLPGRRPPPRSVGVNPPTAASSSSPDKAHVPAEPFGNGSSSPATISVPLPEPQDIPAAGLVAAALLLAVVGSASVATRRETTAR